MAAPRLRAEFFVDRDGVATRKAKPLPRAAAFRFYMASDKRCALCGAEVRFGGRDVSPFQRIRSGHIDHIMPRARGGQNDTTNLRLLCMSCNCQKGAR